MHEEVINEQYLSSYKGVDGMDVWLCRKCDVHIGRDIVSAINHQMLHQILEKLDDDT